MTPARRIVLVMALLCVATAVWFVGFRDRSDSPALEVYSASGAADHDFVIPAGTSDRLLAGEQVELIPQRLDVEVGESIRIRNQDDEGAQVGIFYVGGGETVRMRFTSPGELTGSCDVHPSGEFTIVVHES